MGSYGNIPGSSPEWRGTNFKSKGKSPVPHVPPSQLGATGWESWTFFQEPCPGFGRCATAPATFGKQHQIVPHLFNLSKTEIMAFRQLHELTETVVHCSSATIGATSSTVTPCLADCLAYYGPHAPARLQCNSQCSAGAAALVVPQASLPPFCTCTNSCQGQFAVCGSCINASSNQC